jgi:hypothetical protein
MPLTAIAGTIGASQLVHRFLILDLQRPGKPKIWLRIDRRRARDKGFIEFVGAGLTTPAHDTVCYCILYPVSSQYTNLPWTIIEAQLADKKDNLIDDNCIHESRQVLSNVRTLGDLRHTFRVINQELKIYEAWPVGSLFHAAIP